MFATSMGVDSFFESLSKGPQTPGWEIDPPSFSYAGKCQALSTFGKSGGAGSFIWFDDEREIICVYLTNNGKPKPFNFKNWNRLMADLARHELLNLLAED